MFAVSGERLTMRLRQMAFKALLRQVLQSYCLITSQLQLSLVMFFVRLRVDNDFYLLISRLERQFGLRGVVLE